MTKTIAKFSNGFKDKYNGKRNVKAAWAIIKIATNETINSGHSLDKETAQRTGTNTLRQWNYNPYTYIGHRCPRYMCSPMEWQRRAIEEAGKKGYPATYKGVQQAKDDLAAKRDELHKQYRIEVVSC